MDTIKNLWVRCPECGEAVAVLVEYLDRAAKTSEDIEAVCIHCEHKWILDAPEKARVLKQRSEVEFIAGAGRS